MTQTSPAAARQLDAIPVHRKSLSQRLRENWQLYVMLLIPVVLTIVYKYWPMYGIQIAFRDFKASRGITGSEWVGLYWFERFFTAPNCVRMIKNTVLLSLYSLLWSFPIPIILSLCINQLRFAKFKRVVQTVVYLPYFVSWVLMAGIIVDIFSPANGLVNKLLGFFGVKPIFFLGDNKWFKFVIILTNVWKEFGWGTIIYMAALSGIDPSLYEAAVIDGAGRIRQTWSITLPGLMPTIVLTATLSLGNILNAGFDQIFMLYSALVYDVADIIDTYVYRVGMTDKLQYSLSTAVGLFKNVIGFALVVTSNAIIRRMGDGGNGIW